MRLLLLSNSTNPAEPYLGYCKQSIASFLGTNPLKIVFIPYAAITFSYDEYVQKVNQGLCQTGHQVIGIHTFKNPKLALEQAEAIMVGGGNTWKLTRMLQELNLLEPIRKAVQKGIPYVGWSAGSNLACPTLRTTNDMPIVEPLNFETLNLIPFQINPHYLDSHPSNHGGETREMRINEFITENTSTFVVGLRESTMLILEHHELKLIGDLPARIFKYGQEPKELRSVDDFNFLINNI